MLLISRLMELWKICSLFLPCLGLINCRLHLFRSSASSIIFSCFSNHQGAVFFFFFFFFPLLSLPLSLLQEHHDGGNFLAECDQSNWLFYVRYYTILYVYGQELVHQLLSLTIYSSAFSSCTTFQSSPNTSVPIF